MLVQTANSAGPDQFPAVRSDRKAFTEAPAWHNAGPSVLIPTRSRDPQAKMFRQLTPAVRALLYANVIVFALTVLAGERTRM